MGSSLVCDDRDEGGGEGPVQSDSTVEPPRGFGQPFSLIDEAAYRSSVGVRLKILCQYRDSTSTTAVMTMTATTMPTTVPMRLVAMVPLTLL
ncbi:hypothetical protein DL770_002370 [Monosporascus sp. CRB-9-2]|nr:hypothetical protein DL770_002370 [Monosporascus sp. CRB-9-2]